MSTRLRGLALGFVLALGAAEGTRGSAQTIRLNPPFDLEAIVGDVQDFRLHPLGTHVLFRADARNEGVFELYKVPVNGSSAPVGVVRLPRNRAVTSYEFSPDGEWVVYLADRDTDEVLELYSQRVGTTDSTRLSGALVAGGDVQAFQVAADSSRVVYLADGTADGVVELFSVPIDGSASPSLLSGLLVTGGNVTGFAVDPTSQRVVYVADQDADERFELYSRALDASGAALKLSGVLPAGGNVLLSPACSPDGARVVYRADASTDGVVEVYSAPLDGSAAPVRLNAGLIAGGAVSDARIAPDGSRVLYLADQDVDGARELYSVPIAGGSAVKLNASLSAGGFVILHDITLAGRAVYTADPPQAGPVLHSVPIDASAPPTLLDDVRHDQVHVSLDGARVVYVETLFSPILGEIPYRLLSVPIGGGAPVRLDDPKGALGRGTPNFAISPDSSRVLFVSFDEEYGYYSAAIDGSSASVALAGGAFGEWALAQSPFAITGAAPARAVFLRYSASGVMELGSSLLASGAGDALLNGPLARGTVEDVAAPSPRPRAFALGAEGASVVYTVNADTEERFQLFASELDGGRLGVALESAGKVWDPKLAPDGTRVVYGFHATLAGSPNELRSAPIDGSGVPVRLGPVSSIGESVFSPDGTEVVCAFGTSLRSVPVAGGPDVVLDGSTQQKTQLRTASGSSRCTYVRQPLPELWSAAIGVAGSALRLSQAPLDVDRYVRTANEVVYTASSGGIAATFALYRAPVDGSSTPVLLSGDVITRFDLALSPDEQWVVFAGEETLDRHELFAVPLDGSASPVQLSGAMVAGGDLFTSGARSAFRVSSDSARVVYLADQLANDVVELFSAPIDGSAAPVRLNAPLVAGGDVYGGVNGEIREHFQITPDGARVLYAADQDTNGVLELYGVPIDASAAPVKLSGPMVPGGGLLTGLFGGFVVPHSFLLVDSVRAVYCADQQTDGLHELYLVPVDGSSAPVMLNWPLTSPGCPGVFELDASSMRVVYQATQRAGVVELFASTLSEIAPRRHLRRQ